MNPSSGTATRKPRKAREVCAPIDLGEEASSLLTDSLGVDDFFLLLRERRLYADALRVAAYALPLREAIWWGCLCAWQFYRPQLPAAADHALKVVVAWVQEPAEETRREAPTAADRAGLATPAGALARAVFLSGGSISLPGLPEVSPEPFLANKFVAVAVLAASWEAHPKPIAERQQQYLKLATDVGDGRFPWLRPGGPALRHNGPIS
ncbi:hypothetical protein AYO40_03395 [Planctomycetaceae bacterium SCGC AG-212-D15]|nr:hypothetical protein AYO40_03395 [Planctomycetaceae bacterium SCGC AG-212-D15]